MARRLRASTPSATPSSTRAGTSPTSTAGTARPRPTSSRAVAEALAFPDDYGQNFDALADASATSAPATATARCCCGTAAARCPPRRAARSRWPSASSAPASTPSAAAVRGAAARRRARRGRRTQPRLSACTDRRRQTTRSVAADGQLAEHAAGALVDVGLVERGQGGVGQLADDRLDLGVRAGAVDDPAQLGDLRRRRAACRASGRAARRPPAEAASSASATSTVRLPSTRSSPAGLPVGGRVAEHAEQVVAELERLAERQAERRQLGQRRRARRRRGRRRCGAGARWSTSPTCSAARSSRRRRRPRPRACTETSRNWPAITSERHRSKTSSAGATRSPGRPQRRSSSSDQLSSRSPSRMAAAAPYCSGSPRHAVAAGARPRSRGAWPAGRAGCRRRPCSRRGPARWRAAAPAPRRRGAGRPRRRPSGCDRAEAPVAEGGPEPLAAGRPSARASASSRAASGPSGAEPVGHLVEEVVERLPGAGRGSRPGPTSASRRRG